MKALTARVTAILVLIAVYAAHPSYVFSNPSKNTGGVSPALASDYIHAAIEANRTIYSQYIVERLGETISLPATENWEEDKTLLLPAQFLLTSSQINNSREKGLKYRLLSLWAINKSNSPKDPKIREALKAVAENPEKINTWKSSKNGKQYFNAVYPDRAVTKSCVTCHNKHSASPRKDFKKGDVMGGIMITLPLGNSKPDEQVSLPLETVSDYIHSVFEADRTVYAKYIVDRLQNENIIYASENWWEENTLLLPAQFLLSSSDLIQNSPLKLGFRLTSLWPINSLNAPSNNFEKEGLESLLKNPTKPVTITKVTDGKKFFQSIYADLAITQACVSCHNDHPRSPKRDFKLNDVIGGLVLTLPVN